MTAIPGFDDAVIVPASTDDIAEIVVLQRCCWVQEAIINETFDIPALHETHDDVAEWCKTWQVWCVRLDGRLIGGIRAFRDGDTWEIGRLMVAPDLAGRGLGRWLLGFVEAQAPDGVTGLLLFTGSKSSRNIRMYQRASYTISTDDHTTPTGHITGVVSLVKPLAAR